VLHLPREPLRRRADAARVHLRGVPQFCYSVVCQNSEHRGSGLLSAFF
jgi:hypothetical protein